LNPYDYYNLVEKSILEMEGEESYRVSDEMLKENGIKKEQLEATV
jgi:hypothetical protein